MMHLALFTPKRNQRTHLLGKWVRKMLQGNNLEMKSVRPLERRTAFRFTFAASDRLSIQIQIRTFRKISTSLYDLSAGGFSCILSQPFPGEVGDWVHLSFTLPLEKQWFIETQAQFLGTRPVNTNDPPGYRFEFASSLTERDRDYLHYFILRKQLDQIRKS